MNTTYFAPMYVKSSEREVSYSDGLEHIVGSYFNTIVFRTGDDRFLPFQAKVIRLVPNDVKTFIDSVNMFKTKANIIIEEDAKLFILLALETIFDNFLIYTMNTKSCITIYEYVAKNYEIQPYTLNLSQINNLIRANIMFTQSFQNSQITWNLKTITNTVIDCGYDLFLNVIKIYLNRITNNTRYSTNKQMLTRLVKYLTENYTDQFKNKIKHFNEFTLQNVNTNDLYNAVSLII